jgi:predicted metal-dependent hydrolase
MVHNTKKPPLPRRERKKVRVENSGVNGEKFIEFVTKYRNIKFPRLEFKSGELEAIMPYCKDPNGILEKYMNWIRRKQEFIISCLEAAKKLETVKRKKEQLKLLVDKTLKRYSMDFGLQVKKVFYRKMRTKWASCSSNHNLTINTMMRHLQKRQIEYILYHELVHMIEKKHNDRFWKLIRKKFKNHEKLEMSLFSYWFLLNSPQVTACNDALME